MAGFLTLLTLAPARLRPGRSLPWPVSLRPFFCGRDLYRVPVSLPKDKRSPFAPTSLEMNQRLPEVGLKTSNTRSPRLPRGCPTLRARRNLCLPERFVLQAGWHRPLKLSAGSGRQLREHCASSSDVLLCLCRFIRSLCLILCLGRDVASDRISRW
jgi:hypothetical protein